MLDGTHLAVLIPAGAVLQRETSMTGGELGDILVVGFGLLNPALSCPLDVFAEGGRLAAKQGSQG